MNHQHPIGGPSNVQLDPGNPHFLGLTKGVQGVVSDVEVGPSMRKDVGHVASIPLDQGLYGSLLGAIKKIPLIFF